MFKFKVYRAFAVVYLLLNIFISFVHLPASLNSNVTNIILMDLMAVILFVCYGLLASIFRFFEQPIWKIIAVGFFIIGNIVFNILPQFMPLPLNKYYSLILIIFYLPLVAAFATLRLPGIKGLAQAFAYCVLIVCIIRMVLPFVRYEINIMPFAFILNIIFIFPPLFMVFLFHKMIDISAEPFEDAIENSEDLL
ncbi:MAG: hypothetical protein JST21_10565 [Bacteroidetes bacterium]|nr:hypothetical protein [Bacteroidota bacterium]